MILEIRKTPDPILSQKCEEVWPSPETSALLHDMVETLQNTPNAYGLAAPQVGVPVRAFVMGTENQGYIACLNPRITKRSGIKQTVVEGCLSQPGKAVKTKRPYSVTVEGIDAEGNAFTFTAKGFAAAGVCHEIDHLDGKLI